jgi:ketosteroid isomerase-like protein
MGTERRCQVARSLMEIARSYLQAVERGATGEALAAFYTDDVVQEEFPNRLVPNGARRDLKALLEGAERGQKVVRDQRYEVLSAAEVGQAAILEVQWSATLSIPLGSIPAGGQMRARLAMFIEFRGEKIARQRNYDCYEPF